MMKRMGVLVALLMACMPAASVNAQVCSTFDSDLDGWTCNTSGCRWADNLGNPDGYLRLDDNNTQPTFAIAPSKFLGDWSRLDGVGEISYEHRIIHPGSDVLEYRPYTIIISGPGGSALWEGATPHGITQWTGNQVQLIETEWQVTSGAWQPLLANVEEMRIWIEQVSGSDAPGDIDGIDNVCFNKPSGACSGGIAPPQ